MRDASGIDPLTAPLTYQDVRRLAEEREAEERAARYRERKRLEKEAADRAEGTLEAKAFMEICTRMAEEAVEAYASGQPSFEQEYDLRSTKEVEDIEKGWMHFRVRVLLNGKLEGALGADELLEHPYRDGYVIVMNTGAPWLEEALVRLLEGAGYRRTTYVSSEGFNHVMANGLAYALPTFRIEDHRQLN